MDFRLKTSAATFEILDSEGTVVHEGSIVKRKYRDKGALEDVWVGDFSSIEVPPGAYRIRLDNGATSDAFRIAPNVYDAVFQTALRGLYVTRCTYAVIDPLVGHDVCHQEAGGAIYTYEDSMDVYTPDDRDVSGGWHNGGDYRRSTISAAQAVHRLLATMEGSPKKFDSYPSTLACGEGPQDWPDLLVEAKWGLDWLVRMQYEATGSVITGLGPATNKHPGMEVAPDDDTTPYYIGTVQGANTGKAGAVFARAARVFRTYDIGLADFYLTRAEKAYAFLATYDGAWGPPSIQTYVFNGKWRQDFLWLALELYLTTGEARYHERFLQLYADIVAEKDNMAFPEESVSTHTMRSENLHETLLRYCQIEELPTDKGVKDTIWAAAQKRLNPLVGKWQDLGYGYVLPDAFWTERHTVGNMMHKAWVLLMAYQASEVMEAEPFKDYQHAALDQINIILGRNTLNRTFVTGIGHRPVTAPHLRLTALGGVPPGMPVKGPSRDSFYIENLLAQGQPVAAAAAANYRDERGKHWVNEPDVEATGYFIAFTGYLASARSQKDAAPQDQVVIRAKGDCGQETMELHLDGCLVKRWENVGTTLTEYTYEGPTEGVLSIHFVNDRRDLTAVGCTDRNLTVDYVAVCGTVYPTKTAATKTSACCAAATNKLFTNGNFNFGRLSCEGEGLRADHQAAGSKTTEVSIYPNPADDRIVVQGPAAYDLVLHDLYGRIVLRRTQLQGVSSLDLTPVPAGVYLLSVRDQHRQLTYTERIVVR